MPIEPEKQTKFIDDLFECIPADRLLYASVPGAGGDDAIFALGLKPCDPEQPPLHKLIQEKFCLDRSNLAVLPVNLT